MSVCPYVLSNMGIMTLQETVRPLHDAGGSVKDPSFEDVKGKILTHDPERSPWLIDDL
jgi:hypothetical protein